MPSTTALQAQPLRPTLPAEAALPRQADTDAQVFALWLHGKSENTREAYRRDIEQLQEYLGHPSLAAITLGGLQDYADHLQAEGLARSTCQRKLAAIKSLLSFAQKIGYLQYNVGAALELPTVRHRLSERILTEAQVQQMIALEPSPRNRSLLRLFYATGGRVSELCGLEVRSCQARVDERTGREGGFVTLWGKGEQERTLRVSPDTWSDLQRLIEGQSPDAPVFRSRKGGRALTRSWVMRLIRRAAVRAGIDKNVSPHWLRHAHASHALDRGAPVQLVRETLGHASLTTTSRYTHARPNTSSGDYLGV